LEKGQLFERYLPPKGMEDLLIVDTHRGGEKCWGKGLSVPEERWVARGPLNERTSSGRMNLSIGGGRETFV